MDFEKVDKDLPVETWGCSSAGRAPALQAGGRQFDSPHLHQVEIRETADNLLKMGL